MPESMDRVAALLLRAEGRGAMTMASKHTRRRLVASPLAGHGPRDHAGQREM